MVSISVEDHMQVPEFDQFASVGHSFSSHLVSWKTFPDIGGDESHKRLLSLMFHDMLIFYWDVHEDGETIVDATNRELRVLEGTCTLDRMSAGIVLVKKKVWSDEELKQHPLDVSRSIFSHQTDATKECPRCTNIYFTAEVH